MERRRFLAATTGLVLAPALAGGSRRSAWRAGMADADITPPPGLWLGGFAARTEAARGTSLPLHAKALVLEDSAGTRAALVTVDVLGVTRSMTAHVAADAEARFGIPRAGLLVNASHTHSAPVVDGQLSVAYDLTPELRQRSREWTVALERTLVRLVRRAVGDLAPARLTFAEGQAEFAANRREQVAPDGPVDHAVPVLEVGTPDGRRIRALVFGYACHNTTLQASFVEYHGDYAGVAQRAIEARHRGALALFVSGCGADANPKPRGTLALAEAHGRALADAVDRTGPARVEVDGPLRVAYEEVSLSFAPVPARSTWEERLHDDNVFVRRHARLMLETLDRDGELPEAQPQPLQIWRLGDLTLVALGGEVVVDYALRLKRERPGTRLWVAGYSGDVFGYVPSLRVLREGGYEGGGAMLYYGKPGPFDDTVEDRIFAALDRLWKDTRR